MEFESANPSADRSSETSTEAAPVAAHRALDVERAAVIGLQRSAGNRATTRLLQRSGEGTRYAERGEFAKLLKELSDRAGVAGPARPVKPAQPSAMWKWMKGKSPQWLQALGLATGLGTAGADENKPIKPAIEEVRKPLEVEEAEREAGDRSRSKKAPRAGPDPPPPRGGTAEGGTRYADRKLFTEILKGGGVFGFGGSVLQGVLADAAMKKRIEQRRQQTGYAAPGSEYQEDDGFWGRVEASARAGMSFFGGEAHLMSERFDAGIWRRRLRALADRVPNDGTLEIGWQIQTGWRESLNPAMVAQGIDVAEIETVRTVYRKIALSFGDPAAEAVGWSVDMQQSERWPAGAALDEPPSLNYILNPRNSDGEIQEYLQVALPSRHEA
jgi:hypothetical protein